MDARIAKTDWFETDKDCWSTSTKASVHIAPEVFILPSVDGADVAMLLAVFDDVTRRLIDDVTRRQESYTNSAAFLALANLMSSVTVRCALLDKSAKTSSFQIC